MHFNAGHNWYFEERKFRMQRVIGDDPSQQQGSSGFACWCSGAFPDACVLLLARCWMAQGSPGCLELRRGRWGGAELLPELVEIVGTRAEAVSYLEESRVVEWGKGSAIFSCWVQGQIPHTTFTEQFSEQRGAGWEIKQLFLILWNLLLWNLLLSPVFSLGKVFFVAILLLCD